MSTGPAPDRIVLEDLWRRRLKDAELRLTFARQYLAEVQRDFPSSRRVHSADGAFAYQHALRAETCALAEYKRVLQIFTAVVIHGKVPAEQ